MRTVLAIAAVAVAILIAGCGDDEEDTTSVTTTDPAATAETTAPDTEATDEGAGEAGDAGGGAESGGVAADSPGAGPESAIEAYFVSGDPELVCDTLATESLIASAYGDAEGCRQAQVPAATADAVVIRKIEKSTDEATATVIPEGGPNDGFEHEVVVVNEGGSWRVDSLEVDVPAGP